MLLFADEIGLGKISSNLLQLLADMVVHLDRDNPSAADLIKKVSLPPPGSGRVFDVLTLGKCAIGIGVLQEI